jgi:site-specific DNA-cytosine methylase
MLEFGVLHLFCGIGGAALGMQHAEEEFRGVRGRFVTLAGVDVDPEACADFETLTGAPAVQMDLFSRSDYAAYHGQEPLADWREVTPADIRAATGGIAPDVVFLSPPCKGFSGLLPGRQAGSPKYRALNNLVPRGLRLTLDAFADDSPAIILLENVPRITSRGADLLREVKHLLRSRGYECTDGYHDCGEIGGLAQRRRRYLLIARLPEKMLSFVYQPPELRVRTIGEVLGLLPLPDAPECGPMHRLPRLQWKTWVRLALIPAGGDWRDLEKIAPQRYRLEYVPRGGGPFGVQGWYQPGATVVGNSSYKGSNAACVADPRLPQPDGAAEEQLVDVQLKCICRDGTMGVQAWQEPSRTVTGSWDVHSGSAAVADPRIPDDDDRPDPPPVIIARDGTWHRPLTTLELAVLQGFPAFLPEGRPLVLAGKSDARWRERIGNAVPPAAARAIGNAILRALIPSIQGVWVMGSTPIWVVPETDSTVKRLVLER